MKLGVSKVSGQGNSLFNNTFDPQFNIERDASITSANLKSNDSGSYDDMAF